MSLLRRSTFALILLAVLTGCCPPPPTPPPPYTGPTDPMDIVVADINRNSVAIPSLWTQLNFTAAFVDPQTQKPGAVAGDGVLMFARSKSLLFNGDKDVAGQVLQLGSNDDEYWLKIRSTASSFNYWWGTYANIGKVGTKAIPIRPDLVIQVLGVSLYRENFLISPVPVMRFDNTADAYVFDLNEVATDRWETREEIWYDRQTKLPTRVLLFGPSGRAVLIANLSQHTPVETPNLPRDRWPLIARHYDLWFPATQSKINFDFLNTPQAQHQSGHHPPVPNPHSFQRPEPGDGDKVIPLGGNDEV